MGNPLRDRRSPSDLAEAGQIIEIAEKISSFKRLASIVETDLAILGAERIPPDWRETDVTGRVEFGFLDAQQRVAGMRGEAGVTIDVVCQRCLEPFRLSLESDWRCRFGEATAGDIGDADVWELDSGTLRPIDVVEESLIMAMPLSAMHTAAEECTTAESVADDAEPVTRPFAGLRRQLERGS